MVKKRGLGKGLDALLGNSTERSSDNSSGSDSLKTLAVDLLQRGQYQPRKDFNQESLQELADSINAQGIVQPIVVRALPRSKKFEIIAGERRWRAAQLAGLQDVPVVVKDVPDKTVMCIALIENIQREDLNPLEEAQALARLIEEFDMTHDTIAEAVGRSRSAVTNLLRLLELNSKVKQLVETRKMDMGHARALLALPLNEQMAAAEAIIKQGLSVRATEKLVQQLLGGSKSGKAKQSSKDPNIQSLENDLSEKMGAKVIIKQQAKGKGVLQINYHSLDELDGILKHFK
ncbi:MAG: putative chromosome-partitioning protein ParB [marine bacterium B5-7]|nr:MAG: putative chromosome-partitioning protein ParB [marine bacterium B5-7]